MLNFNKNLEFALDEKIASDILEKVFEENQVEPNSIPLEVLTSYSNYRKERFAFQRTVLLIILILFLMLPFLFISPTFTLESADNSYTSTPAFHISVDTFMPVSRVTATIDGHNIPVYEMDAHEYSIEPTMNGRMLVTVTLINHQKVTHFIDVGNVDMEAPVIVSNDWDGTNIYLNLSDADSGINFEEIKAVDEKGNTFAPVDYDEATGRVAFLYPESSLNVYIPDNAGNTLQLVLSVR